LLDATVDVGVDTKYGDCASPVALDLQSNSELPRDNGLVSWPATCFHNDVCGLLKKVCVRAKHEYTDEYPGKMPATIAVRFQDGQVIEHEVQNYPGLASPPFTWKESVEKFERLVAGRTDDMLCREIKDAIRSLESIQVSDVMQLLGRVKGIPAEGQVNRAA